MARTHPWEVSDALWERVEPLIPPAPSHAKGGRPRILDRQAFAAIVYVLRTGIQWNALPRELGASSTIHDRFQEWVLSAQLLECSQELSDVEIAQEEEEEAILLGRLDRSQWSVVLRKNARGRLLEMARSGDWQKVSATGVL